MYKIIEILYNALVCWLIVTGLACVLWLALT